MNKLAQILILSLLIVSGANAGPKTFARSVAHEVKMTFVDIKRHPFAWGLQAAALTAINFADAGSTCKFRSLGVREANPLLGSVPGCPQVVGFMAVGTVMQLTAIHAVTQAYVDSCYRDAANPASRWNRTPAHSHDPESCRFAIPTAVVLTAVPIHWHIVQSNIHIIREVEDWRAASRKGIRP